MKEKIGIISDTHGLMRPEVLEILKDCKYILHAGDVNKDEILDVLRSMGNLYVVRGNNDKDWAENLRTSLSFTIAGVKFFMVHNKKDVVWDLGDTQVVIFGHTHKYFEKYVDGRLWLNLWKKSFWRRGHYGGNDRGGRTVSDRKDYTVAFLYFMGNNPCNLRFGAYNKKTFKTKSGKTTFAMSV